MKKTNLLMIVAVAVLQTACNNNTGNKSALADTSTMKNDVLAEQVDTSKLAVIHPIYSGFDTKISGVLLSIVNSYLQIKNALTDDNSNDAAQGGKSMSAALKEMNTALFTAAQKNTYDDIEDDLSEHAEHIGKNAGNIDHQREHFSMMSEDIYDLVKAFGGGLTLYLDFCPMYNDGKGAMWLSEKIPVKNPYYGNKMSGCGTVKEIIK